MYQNFLNFLNVALALTLGVIVSFPASTQTPQIDSLRQLLVHENGATRADILYELGYRYIALDHSQALRYGDESYQIAADIGDSLRIVKATLIRGSALRRMEQLDEAIRVSVEGLDIAKRNGFDKEYKILLNSIAIAYSLKAEYDKALDYHYQSLIIRELSGNKSEISITLNNIGFVYFKLRNYQQAVEYFNRSLALRKEVNDTYDMDRLLVNLGTCHIHLGNFQKALDFIQEGLKICGNDCTDQIKLEGLFSLGVSYFGLNEYSEAKSHFEQSLAIAKQIGSKRFQAENLVYLGKIAMHNERFDAAEKMFQEAESLATEAGYNQLLIDAYKQFSILYNDQKDFERAAIHQRKYIALKDSLIGEDLVNNIAKIQTRFEERVNLQTIAEKEETIARQRALNISIAVIAILAGALIFVLYHSIKVKRKVNADLSDAKAIIEEQNKKLLSSNVELNRELQEKNVDLQKANESLQKVNEELDNFIYKTSHDIRGPLASLKGMCNVALMDVKDPVALSYLEKLDVTAEKLNTILTRLLIVNQINNSSLSAERIDFNAIVDDVLTLERKKGLPRRLAINRNICPKVDLRSDPQFVRIIMENLIDNAIKFYNDSDRVEPFVNIAIHQDDDNTVAIHVVDNGIGISEVHPDKIFQMFSRASERSETGGIGLYITKTAAEKLGGSVHLKTTPEGWTEFYVKLPFAQARVYA